MKIIALPQLFDRVYIACGGLASPAYRYFKERDFATSESNIRDYPLSQESVFPSNFLIIPRNTARRLLNKESLACNQQRRSIIIRANNTKISMGMQMHVYTWRGRRRQRAVGSGAPKKYSRDQIFPPIGGVTFHQRGCGGGGGGEPVAKKRATPPAVLSPLRALICIPNYPLANTPSRARDMLLQSNESPRAHIAYPFVPDKYRLGSARLEPTRG